MYWSSTQPTVQPWHSAQDRPCSSSDNGRKHAESMHSHYAAWAPCHPSAITPGPFLTSLRKSTNVFDEAQIHKLHIGTYRPLKCISHNSQQKKKKQKNTLFICLLQTLCNIYLPYEKNVKGAEERSNKANNVLGIHVSWNEISFT